MNKEELQHFNELIKAKQFQEAFKYLQSILIINIDSIKKRLENLEERSKSWQKEEDQK